MKPTIFRTGLLVACFLAGSVTAQQATEPPADQPLVIIGDQVITAGEFGRELQQRVAQRRAATGKTVNPDVAFRRAVMNEMIAGRILSITAANSDIAISDEDVDREFDEGKAMFDTEEAYANYLKRLNITEDALKENIRTRLQIKAFLDREIGEPTVSEDEIAEAYDILEVQGAMKRTETTRDVAVMLFRAKGGTDESWLAAEERAKAARARVEAGEEFSDVAREVSEDPVTAPEGGLLREVKSGGYPELQTAIEALEVDELSEPVRSVMGWYLLKVVTVNEPGVIPLESVRDRLEKEVREKKRAEATAELVKDAQLLMRVEILERPEEAGAPAAETGEN